MTIDLYRLIGVVVCACLSILFLLVVQGILVFRKLKPKSSRKGRNGTVVLHQMPPNNRVLSVSPPCLKLEAYLRMNNIPYESDYSFSVSSKGKVPWIEYNGNSVADSNFIIRFLNEEFKFDPDAHLSVVEKAIAHSLQVTLEENTYWTLIYHSFVADLTDTRTMSPLLGVMPFPLKHIMSWLVSYHMGQSLWSHGIGRHSRQEIYSIAEKDLGAVSQLLGKKKFVMGNKPCLLDAAVFGLVAVILWNVPHSPQAKLIRSQLKNLEAHCYAIKEDYFPDWDQLILKHKLSP